MDFQVVSVLRSSSFQEIFPHDLVGTKAVKQFAMFIFSCDGCSMSEPVTVDELPAVRVLAPRSAPERPNVDWLWIIHSCCI